MNENPFERLNVIIEEIERLDKESSVPDGESNPALQPLFEEGNAIVRRMDPLVREHYRDQPEKLAEWESILKDYPDLLAADETEQAKAEAAKEAEGLKLAEEIGTVMDRISADMDRLMTHDGPDLETEAVLARSFAAMHSMDIQMRLRCRDFPEQLEKWKAMMEQFEEVEAANKPTLDVVQLNSHAKIVMTDEELAEKLTLISANLDRFKDRQPPDLEVDEALEQSFREIHEVNEVMRVKCRDFPEKLLEWEKVVEHLQEVEERYRLGLEFENSAPEN